MLELIDTHAHLDIPEFDASRAGLLVQCAQDGMRAIVVPAVIRSTWLQLQAICASDALLWPAYGLHPCYMDQHSLQDVADLESFLESGAVAVGEIGLDVWHGDADLLQQQEIFSAQLSVAKNADLPVVLHARKTHDLLLKEIRQQHFQAGGVVHAFSGSLQQAQKFIELGFVIGFGGGATYDRAQKLRAILKSIPLSAVVLETDSPDIPPSFARGQQNTPANLFRITEILAEVLELEPALLAQLTTQNARRIFRRPG